MRIFELCTELAPFSQVGGLGRSMDGLIKSLSKKGHDVSVLSPYYRRLFESENYSSSLRTVVVYKFIQKSRKNKSLNFNNPSHSLCETLKESRSNEGTLDNEAKEGWLIRRIIPGKSRVGYYFFDNFYYFRFRDIYRQEDDNLRFHSFCIGALEWLTFLKLQNKWSPDIIHCHDWHTGYFIELAKRSTKYKRFFKNIPIIFTVHNFKYQNKLRIEYMSPSSEDLGIKVLSSPSSNEFDLQNALIRGLKYADLVTTVSETHRNEIITNTFKFNIEKISRKIKAKFTGILNGVDYEYFNPNNKHDIAYPFNFKTFKTERSKNKMYLQKKFSLPIGDDKFLMAFVGRLYPQKGIDLIVEAIPEFLRKYSDGQLIVIGGGEESLLEKVWMMKRQFPDQVEFNLVPNFDLPKMVYSGSDIVLLPSQFEPCGNVAQEAMSYGCIPLVRNTGGLSEIVSEYNDSNSSGNGFKFESYNSRDFYKKLTVAYKLFRDKRRWNKIIQNCFRYRRSWDDAADEYLDLFNTVKFNGNKK